MTCSNCGIKNEKNTYFCIRCGTKLYSAVLKCQNSNQSDMIFYVLKQTTNIGRDRNNDIVIPDSQVSRRHAQIYTEKEQFILKDRDSHNGTLVNNKIIDMAELKNRDIIQLGNMRFLFQTDNISEPISTNPDEQIIAQVNQTLSMIDHSYLKSHTVKEAIAVIIDMLIEISLCQRGYLILYGPEKENKFTLARNIKAETISDENIKISSTAVKKALKTEEIVFAENMPLDSNFSAQESIVKLQLMSLVCIPLIATNPKSQYNNYGFRMNGKLILGMLYADTWQINQILPPKRKEILKTVSPQILHTIESILTFQK